MTTHAVITERAKVLATELPEPEREKQQVGRIILPEINSRELEKSNAIIRRQIIHIPEGITCINMCHATEDQKERIAEYLSMIVKPENKYNAFHYTHLQNIIFIHIPKSTEATEPVVIKKNVEGNTAFHHVIIIAEQGSAATIIEEETSGSKTAGYKSTVVEAVVKKNAKMTYICIQNYDKKTTHYVNKKAHVQQDGQMHWIEGYFGAQYTQSMVSTVLEENGASATNTTLFFGSDNQKFDLYSTTIQEGKHTNAMMAALGVVEDTAKSMCKGKIKIGKQAYGSQGHQKAKTLIMNSKAQANAIPSMEIDNFDVRATHEASVGQVDEKKLFYLMSRGLTEKQARTEIVQGFFVPIIITIPYEEIQTMLRKMMRNKLKINE